MQASTMTKLLLFGCLLSLSLVRCQRSCNCSAALEEIELIQGLVSVFDARVKEVSELVICNGETEPTGLPTEPTEPPTEVEYPIGSEQNPAQSCQDIPTNFTSGEYFLLNSINQTITAYCDTGSRSQCSCNNAKTGWMRVVDIDMQLDGEECPDGFEKTQSGDYCRRQNERQNCASTIFSTNGVEYTQVCGRVEGQQRGTPDAFISQRGIDRNYVDGVSLTHRQEGQTREHIWTFAAGFSDDVTGIASCPCNKGSNQMAPDFVHMGALMGGHYFCESGRASKDDNRDPQRWFGDSLWNGSGCSMRAERCCQGDGTFCRSLPEPTADDIELRLCLDQETSDENLRLHIIEIYVQ